MRQEPPRYADLDLIEEELRAVFDSLFAEPPVLDCTDRWDGENLELIQGKRYDETEDVLGGNLDCFPLLSAMPWEHGCYYVGTCLLECLYYIRWSRESFPHGDFGGILLMPYITMMSFLKQPESGEWLRSESRICGVVVGVLDALINNSGLVDHEEERVEEVRRLRKALVPEQYGKPGAPD